MKYIVLALFVVSLLLGCSKNVSKCPSESLFVAECNSDAHKRETERLLTLGIIANSSSKPILGSSTSTGTPSEYTEVTGVVSVHNTKRTTEGVSLPDMSWDGTVAAYSKSKAEYLANNGCVLNHNIGPTRPSDYGENLFWGSGTSYTAEQVVQAWYSEKQYYTYSTNTCTGVCGHYTQVVWKTSVKLGCYAAKCPNNGGVIWACNYNPPGNYTGQKPY